MRNQYFLWEMRINMVISGRFNNVLIMRHPVSLTIRLLICILFFHSSANAQTYVFAQLNGSPVNTAGWNFQGAATIRNLLYNDNSEILLCDKSANKSGAVFFNQPINLSICSKWKAEFDFRMNDGTSADGIAFCFLDVPPVGFITGGGLGIPATANGLKVCFDTYNNCENDVRKDMPKVEIRWGTGYDECNAGQPTKLNVNGDLDSLRPSLYTHAKIEYDNGTITVSINNKQVVTGNQQFNFSGYLGFTASTGGRNDNHSIRNVIIYTDMPPSVANSSSSPVSFCPNAPTQIGTTNNPNYTYAWSPSQGLSNATGSNPFLTVDNTTDSLITAKYYVQTAFANNPGCYSKDSITVTVFPRPSISFLTPAICLNDATAQFTNGSQSKDPGSYPFQYLWKFGDIANATLANPNIASNQHASHIYSKAANYQVQLTVTSQQGCVDSLTKLFTVNGAIPKAHFVLPQIGLLCGNDSIFLQDQSSVDFGAITRVEIYWDRANNLTDKLVDDHPYAGKKYAHKYSAFAKPGTKPVQIRYISYSGISCFKEFDTTIALLASPKLVFDSIPATCDNLFPFQIKPATLLENMNISGLFTFSGKAISVNGIFDPVQAGAGIYSIQYAYMADNGCKDSAYRTITVWPAPLVNAGTNLFVLEGAGASFNASATGYPSRFKWTPATFLDSDTALAPRVTPTQDMIYYFRATDLHTCTNMDSVFVKVLLAPEVPNVFSPNGDNINDTWIVKYLDDYPDCVVQVFTRSGQRVYQTQGFPKPWDGTFKGSPLPIGTYYYVIQPKRGRAVLSGSVTILR
ncbi:MAG: gliding motility-associated C-terminal domain-containing protein [Sediminibacterium sp.]|nr:gliding motility-associated C-terminal domain-containing protein [Sediminibacterium sp.]